jgi:hypothetical protein
MGPASTGAIGCRGSLKQRRIFSPKAHCCMEPAWARASEAHACRTCRQLQPSADVFFFNAGTLQERHRRHHPGLGLGFSGNLEAPHGPTRAPAMVCPAEAHLHRARQQHRAARSRTMGTMGTMGLATGHARVLCGWEQGPICPRGSSGPFVQEHNSK